MSEPIVVIGRFTVKPGKLDDFKQFARELSRSFEAEKPRTEVFVMYLDEDGTEGTSVHVFPDAEAMDLHAEGGEELAPAAYELLEMRGSRSTEDQATRSSRRRADTRGRTVSRTPRST
jgi:quinol monooxygenase YgiN